jgi:hypothetical protein
VGSGLTLLVAGFNKEVYHPEWLANLVLVLKMNNNEWRMCVDYTDLNRYCPKDPFTLPRIDQVINSTAGCVLLSFLDCYSSYHQIALKEEDQIKTAFITPFGAYAYKTMSFGFKIVGVTYQRAILLCLYYRHNLARPRSKMGSKDNYSGLANRPLRGHLRPGWAMYLDRYVRSK